MPPRERRCEGIGEKGVFGHVESKNQQKNKARAANFAASAQHKEHKSESNLKIYQTAHNNVDIQNARIEKAKKEGLKGHGSATSNSGRNNATTQGLNRVNK
jgi:hypothetical protein